MSEELWYVKLANGDVHRVTLDQLDGAFQAGHIDESTMVLSDGATTWTTLGDLVGGGDEGDGESQSASDDQSADDSSGSWDIPAHLKDAPVEDVAARPEAYAAPAQPAYVQPAYAQPAYAQPAYAQPAYAQPAPAARPYAAPSSIAPATPGYAVSSLRPMSVDLGDMDADVTYPKKSRKGFFVAVLGLAAIAGGIGFAAQKFHPGGVGGEDISKVAAAAAMAAPPPVADPEPAPAPAPPPVAPATVSGTTPSTASAASPSTESGSPLNPSFTNRLNEDTKLKLLSADKGREAKAKSRHAGGGGGSHASSKGSKSTNFTTGGNKFDPLNSSI
jgi:hypothetical protein